MAHGNNRKKWSLLVCLLLCMTFLTACGADGRGTKVVFTTGFGADEVFRIAGTGCTRAEIMVYLTTARNRYESVYGAEVWSVEKDGVTLEGNVKENVLEKLAQIKTMCLLAKEKGVALDETEKEAAKEAAAVYYAALDDVQRELTGADEETLSGMYEEYALANKVYEYIIRDVNPEISDDEARTITVQQIFLRTAAQDGADAAYSAAAKEAVYEKACEIREQAVSGGQDFAELASRYSDDAGITFSFGKGELETVLEEAAFSLETGEISPVLETADGFYIYQCISTFDREQTELSKQEIVEQRKKEVFGEEYDAFAKTLVRQLNTKLWEEITLLQGEAVADVDFFEVYSRYF